MTRAWWTLWTLGAILILSQEGVSTQTTLSCDPSGICDGRSRDFHSIPSGLTAAVRSLDLSNNKISFMSKTDLQGCVNLQTLKLRFNEINSIEEDSFRSLGLLEYLDLSYNQLSNLSSSWFWPLSSLKYLDLRENPYQTLGARPLFSPLTHLRILRIGHRSTFMKIQKTDLAGLMFLEQLEIEASSLQTYEPTSLASVQHIHYLILHLKQHVWLLEIFMDVFHSVESLELRGTDLKDFHYPDLPVYKGSSLMRKLTFRGVEATDESFSGLLSLLNHAPGVQEAEFDDCTLYGQGAFYPSEKQVKAVRSLETLTIRTLRIPKFFLFYDLQSIYSLLGSMKSITIENSKVFLVPCSLSQHLRSLEYLDLSDNLMVEEYLSNSACEGAWPCLRTLILRANHLTSLEKTATILLTLKNLTKLDISKNSFLSMPATCRWPEKINHLNLSSTRMNSLSSCLPATLEVLDVSNNNLHSFSLMLPQLRELYLSRNKLKTLPSASCLPALRVLSIRRNMINTFSKEELDPFQELKVLDVGNNNFICSCEFLSFTREQPGLAQLLRDWPDHYLCDSPTYVRGQRVQDTQLPVTECHLAALVSVTCCILLLLILLIVVLCYRFHGLWYLKMTWAWLKAKRKPRRAVPRDICYDAFVSYSEHDSYWVETLMVQELEHFEPPLKLCLHKRDFIPGKWIIDNIIDCIEKSHKTIFVLSASFVKSEWCKYELDFSHFRLFDENNDAAILVLLEPIEKRAIPQRFCKLRKVMNTKTYLEWPHNEEEQRGFWLSLREAIKS
ncbi:toll-like receptor 2 [Sorex fumeus]|uniref:toll-like receptor 2 n=1 Tax=Sorex fumeus TaxID=62283 RepID=UPI0024AE86C4|nr:toll-like receptor 2 [Sorex fumeus]